MKCRDNGSAVLNTNRYRVVKQGYESAADRNNKETEEEREREREVVGRCGQPTTVKRGGIDRRN
jgi:hypothetical protein